jgi:hypothetical protein
MAVVNEIHAPIYVKGKYSTPIYSQGHAFRLYFAAGSSWIPGLTGDEENWRLQTGEGDQGAISGIVHEVFRRAAPVLMAGTAIQSIELWQSVPDADNLLVHLNPLPTGNSFGSGSQHASSFYMWVFAGALRDQFRFTLFDGVNPEPQKFSPITPPTGDDEGLEWYFINSDIPFATNDGIRITREVSRNSGYNRRLARRYGRSITP